MSKAKEFMQQMVACKTEDSAKAIIVAIMSELNLTKDYSSLIKTQQELSDFQKEFRLIQEKYREMGDDIHQSSAVNDIRLEGTFLYREISDVLSSKVNFAKKFFEEGKTSYRAKAREELVSKDKQAQSKRSETLIREYIGEANIYDEWVKNNALAYANYRELDSLLESIKLFNDALSSEVRALYLIEARDVK